MRRKNRKGRALNGILLLDKPTAITSNSALQQAKRIFFAEKAGHTGALDPLATGMLPICFGEATKFSQYLLESDKRYLVVAKLGEKTNTSDADGEVILTRDVNVSQVTLENSLAKFRGVSEQIPSMYSALKYQGKPLYEYARAGIDVPRQSRQIKVHEINLLRFENDEVEMEIHCSKGTYIRTIVDDLGEMLVCGAHVLKLHRSQVASYPANKVVTLDKLEATLEDARRQEVAPSSLLDEFLVPIETSVIDMVKLCIEPELVRLLKQGQSVQVLGQGIEGLVRLHCADDDHFLGVAILNDEGVLSPKRLIIN